MQLIWGVYLTGEIRSEFDMCHIDALSQSAGSMHTRGIKQKGSTYELH